MADAYKGVMDDITKLQAEHRLYVITNSEAGGDVLYAPDPRVDVPVDEDLHTLWAEVGAKVPSDRRELDAALKAHHIQPSVRVVNRRKKDTDKKDKKRKERDWAKRKVTNVHLMDVLFKNGPTPDSID